MRHRIFISALLPNELKTKLTDFQSDFRNLNLRWAKPENLHLTLIFIGWAEESEIITIKEVLKEISQSFSPFNLKLTRLSAGPNLKFPRMIWASGPQNQYLEKIYQDIKDNFIKLNIPLDERHPFKIHITLARAKDKELKGRNVKRTLDLSFFIREIALMESQLKTSGAEYEVLEKYSLKV